MQDIKLLVTFCSEVLSERSQLARSLATHLNATGSDIHINLKREDSDTMDFGAALAIILGTASIQALAEGIADWIRQKNGAIITVTLNGSTLKLEKVKFSEMQSLIERFVAENANSR